MTASINIFNNVSCNGFCDGDATITASQGAPGYSYLWSSGQSTVTAGNLCPGTYIVTVTDSENCMAIDQITITQPNILQSDVTGPDLFCYGDADSDIDLSVTGGTSPYSYSWSNGATTQDISNLAAGSYSITITDANDCQAFDGITINQPAALTASFDNTMISCNGANNGEINLNISEGTSPYSYLWTTGDTIEDLSTLGPGFYFVTITDAHGCTIMALTTITEPDILAVTYTSHNPWNGNNGDIDLEVSGGTEPYSYLWNDGTTTEDRTGLAAGNYSVVVTDANSCTALSSSIVLTTGINETDVIKPIAVYPNPTKGLLHIDNAANATITIYDMLGKVVMGVKKASDKFTFDLSKKPEGAYFVKIITNNKTITRKIILTK
ncbi:MAG: T9SS type A sorting domain-containing protein [Bacteroidia bacterium]|nr:T9SS type A sorting domain-containing protein [Bacteroidia bacterium]